MRAAILARNLWIGLLWVGRTPSSAADPLVGLPLGERDLERERRFEAKLKRQAQQRGYKLVPIEEKPAA
jgi:hypothetical protein